jgi:hypothetical protein
VDSALRTSLVDDYNTLAIGDLATILALHFTGPAPSTDAEKDEAYIIAKRALARLFQEDPVRFEHVARKIKTQLGHSLESIRRDMKLFVTASPFTSMNGSVNQGAAASISQATRLVSFALKNCVLWHTRDAEAWATVTIDTHQEHYPLRKKQFRLWLKRTFHEEEETVAGTQAAQEALEVLEAKALQAPEFPVFLRVAEHDGKIYLDLGRSAARIVVRPIID